MLLDAAIAPTPLQSLSSGEGVINTLQNIHDK